MARHLYIAGVDYWPPANDNLTIEQALTYQIDTCSFHVSGVQPVEGEEVIIEDDYKGRLFAGIIVKVELIDKDLKIWAVECDDYTALLDRRLVVESYENMSASDIFLDIVAKYCPGFTTNGVRPGAPVIESTGAEFEYKRPSECFKWLCDYVGWHWQPDYYKDLSFFSVDDLASPAPLELVPGGPFRFGKHSIDTQGLRNRVYVRGGTMLSDPQTIQWKADGVARVWTLPWGPHEVSLTVGEVPMTVGVENLHDEADYDYMMSFSEKYIRCSAQTATPVEGITMALTARQDIPVITMVEDYASQAAIAKVQGGDGIYEHVISDDSLTSIAAAEAAGMADLREHANPRVKGSFETEYAVPPVPVEKTALEHSETVFESGTLAGLEMTEDGLKLEKTGQDFSYSETSQEDFGQGTLTNVVATSAGDLELARVPGALNLLTANQSSIETDTTGFLRYDSYATVSRDTTEHWHGSASLKTVTTAANSGFYFTRPVQNAGTYTFSVYIKLTQSTGVNITIDGTNVVIANDDFSLQAGVWTRISSTFTTTAATTAYIHVRCSIATTFFADGLQLEERPQASPWTLGGTVSPDTYATSGTREKIVDLSGANPAGGTKIEWSATTPTGTTVTVETTLSLDGGSTYGAWQEATNGGSIPGITTETDLSNARLKIRQTLTTTDPDLTPVLHSFFVNIFGEDYAPLGYYISPALPLKLNYGEITFSLVNWDSEGEGVLVEVDISLDGGKTWEGWQECEAFGVIPVLPVGMMLSGSPAVRYRVTLSTEDPSASPAFSQIDLSALAEVLESHNWQPGQIVDIRLPDRGVEGEYLIQRVTITPTWSNPSIWTFRVDYGGRLLGIADFLKALVSAQQKKRIIEPTRNVQKYIYSEDTLELSDEIITTPRTLPFVCGDPDAVCGLVVVSNG